LNKTHFYLQNKQEFSVFFSLLYSKPYRFSPHPQQNFAQSTGNASPH